MRKRLLLLASVAVVSATSLTTAASEQQALVREGETFYQEGRTADGETIDALVQDDIRVSSREMPCANCHRRSGWGTSEGQVTVPPVVGSVLFAPLTRGISQMGTLKTSGPGARPAYADDTLLRALRDGIDAGGRTMAATMPRYRLSERTARAIAAYLRSLASGAAAGVTGDAVHLATITGPDVSDDRRASLLNVLNTYARHKNANTRNEQGRRTRGPWDMAREFQNYRRWVLHEWRLRGEPHEWQRQLKEFYRAQPIYAIVGGIGDDDWTPVHQFAEQVGLPVVLPHVAAPPATAAQESFYSLYFSTGIHLEAALLADHLAQTTPQPRVWQLSRCSGPGQLAAKALAARLPDIASHCLRDFTSPPPRDWVRAAEDGPGGVLVLWLTAPELDAWSGHVARDTALERSPAWYVSSTLLSDRIRTLPVHRGVSTYLVHPFVLPDEFERHTSRALAWLRAHQVEAPDRGVAVNALFAASLVADALSVPHVLQSREYFIERIEHMAGRLPQPSTYPALRLGARRHVASGGGYILSVPPTSTARFGKVTEWYSVSH